MSSPGQAANPATANLDASKVNEAGLSEAAFPGQFQRDFRIHWEEKVHDEVIKHAAETTDVELCGVLVGKVVKDRDGPYLTISGSIRGGRVFLVGAPQLLQLYAHACARSGHETVLLDGAAAALRGLFQVHRQLT